MWKYARLTKIIMVLCIILAVGNQNINLIRILITWNIDFRRTPKNETFMKPMFVKSDFYFDDQEDPLHRILFTSQYLACTFVNISFIAYDGYFFLSMLHFSGQLYNLQNQIENITDTQKEKNCSFAEVLGPVIEKHRDLCRYCKILYIVM